MNWAGIDIGSLSAKTVILNDNEIRAQAIVLTEPDSVESANKTMNEALKLSKLTYSDIKYIVATGYGRINVPFANEHITEISCHAKGAHWLFPTVRTILDMGGQDCKAIRCNGEGKVTDFMMNDKCAAGTGRFLELIAETLDVPLEEIGPLSLKGTDTVSISSICAVFATQEIAALIRKGIKKENILSSLFESITDRVMGLTERVTIEPDFIVTGGIAKNIGVINKIQGRLGDLEVLRPQEPQIIGALGAALFARERLLQSSS